MKMELRRLIFEEQARSERRRGAGAVESQVTGSLKPWREVVIPYKDVAGGRYQQAEFFHRTNLTESLKSLLSGAMQRLSGDGGEPHACRDNSLSRTVAT